MSLRTLNGALCTKKFANTNKQVAIGIELLINNRSVGYVRTSGSNFGQGWAVRINRQDSLRPVSLWTLRKTLMSAS